MVFELGDLEKNVASTEKAAKIGENRTLSSKRKEKKKSTEFKPKDKKTMEKAAKKPAGTSEALKILEVEKPQSSNTKSMHVVHWL